MSDIAQFLNLIWLPGEVRELRVPKTAKGTVSGYYSDPEAMARDAEKVSESAVWSEQFVRVGFAKSNPWKEVPKTEADKPAKPEPTADAMQTLFGYVQTRYPDWKALHALIELKALSACRLRDVCLLESDQVNDGRVTWRAEQTKQREGNDRED